MTEKIVVHVDSTEQDLDIPMTDRCPEHPEAEVGQGFGLAGGGYGVYEYCSECGRIISKTQVHE